MQADGQMRVVLVTGPGGAGRTTAIRALEDAGFEAIDNMPLSLIPGLLAGARRERPIALGLDARNRDFSAGAFLQLLDDLATDPGIVAESLFIDASPGTLVSRYSETRRRHPLAPAEEPERGIARELDLLREVRDRADALIDTTAMTPHELRAEVQRRYAAGEGGAMAVTVMSFSYKRGIPRSAETVLDVRFLRNPYWDTELRPLTGLDPAVRAHVAGDRRFHDFLDRAHALLRLTLPAHAAEGRTSVTVAFGCTGGRHRSVTLAETVGSSLAESGYRVSIRHREMERAGAAEGTGRGGAGAATGAASDASMGRAV